MSDIDEVSIIEARLIIDEAICEVLDDSFVSFDDRLRAEVMLTNASHYLFEQIPSYCADIWK